ncbi:MAG: hypothetical protein WBB23_07605, partial [Desulforhopalus sp.]
LQREPGNRIFVVSGAITENQLLSTTLPDTRPETICRNNLEASSIYDAPFAAVFLKTTSAFQTCPKCSIYYEFCGT